MWPPKTSRCFSISDQPQIQPDSCSSDPQWFKNWVITKPYHSLNLCLWSLSGYVGWFSRSHRYLSNLNEALLNVRREVSSSVSQEHLTHTPPASQRCPCPLPSGLPGIDYSSYCITPSALPLLDVPFFFRYESLSVPQQGPHLIHFFVLSKESGCWGVAE